jgi:hypothetical protein
MATIIGSVIFEETFEDMLELALFPPAAQYTTFDVTFTPNQRLKGSESFENHASHGLFPLVAWDCVNAWIIREFAAQSYLWRARMELQFCQIGTNDIDQVDSVPVRKQLNRWQNQASEAIKKQNGGTAYSDGAFFRQNAAVTAPGVQILGVGDVNITPGQPVRDTTLGADVWRLRMFADIDVACGPGS